MYVYLLPFRIMSTRARSREEEVGGALDAHYAHGAYNMPFSPPASQPAATLLLVFGINRFRRRKSLSFPTYILYIYIAPGIPHSMPDIWTIGYIPNVILDLYQE